MGKGPWKLNICPSLSAAPRIRESLETSLFMFASLIISEVGCAVLDFATRRKLSPTAPNAMDVASPPYCQNLPSRDEGTLDSFIGATDVNVSLLSSETADEPL